MSWLKSFTNYAMGGEEEREKGEDKTTLDTWIESLRLAVERFGPTPLASPLSNLWATACRKADGGDLSPNQRTILRRCARLVETLNPPLEPKQQERLLRAFEAAQEELDRDQKTNFDAAEYRLQQVERDLGL